MQQKFCESSIATKMFRLHINSFLHKEFDRNCSDTILRKESIHNLHNNFFFQSRANEKFFEKPDNWNKGLENFVGKQTKNDWFTPWRPKVTKFTQRTYLRTISHTPKALQKPCITV